jgi:hypothetical protein
MRRRETFVLVPRPGTGEEAQKALSDWLRSIDGYPGYLGGFVLKESSGELLPDTLVVQLDLDGEKEIRMGFWNRLEQETNPLYPDDKSTDPPDQGAVIFDRPEGEVELEYNQGDGMFAQLLHIHANLVDEYTPRVPNPA